MEPRRLLVVRHGESTWNAEGRWQGQADPPLSERGERQATEAATRLTGAIDGDSSGDSSGDIDGDVGGGISGPIGGPIRGPISSPISEVWSSDLVRARRTAELLAAGRAVQVDARLRERDAGEWTGLTRDEIDTRFPGYLDDGLRPPGWEPDEPFRSRALGVLTDIVAGASREGAVLVVTHGGLLRAVEAALGAEPDGVPNLGGRWLDAQRGRGERGGHGSGLALGPRVVLVTHDITVPRQM